ncbi:acyl-CoA ligase (AMP-forming), exosortase A system-associated [Acidovorax carolinensis]|uniref:Acyl-CoA ligase (AMP-forming), exosortase A system-associated n=1 Tax=Acidovorax carolinensis TaxID=553814 RepID=A0A240U5N7_9BURK|nr:acyl-CoA ligase (AMP-forming), exosortase A system-associated [Acidovorax carolinensis]ART53132.1 acyl-CoA ligase (AMP-forming), exosortase A system-associated [Acidovorax carolinensis]
MPHAPDFHSGVPPVLLHELPARAAACWPGRTALTVDGMHLSYANLQSQVERFSAGLLALGLERGARVVVYLEKRVETVVASFAAPAAGGVLVPVNPLLKSAQVVHILQDAQAQVLVTSAARLAALAPVLESCPGLQHVVLCDRLVRATADALPVRMAWHAWPDVLDSHSAALPAQLDTDVAVIFYTSGSTGQPKGVVLSHRNLVAGATSVASYLNNRADDTLLAVLPLSFDAGFSQLTTAFLVGARVVLLNYLLPRDVLQAMVRERVTGLTAVPPLYMQLAALDWPAGAAQHLRYWANTGGRMPRTTLQRLRALAPSALPYLMYGLTEAFRSTYLPPEEVDRRPDSIGRAIPNAEVRVLREDGTECAVDEPGELVHRGPLVALGYWRRPEETAHRFKPWPPALLTAGGDWRAPERAVYSGDTVRRDADGFLYFVGRRDEMIKTSGYRVSPTEVEEVLYASGLVAEALVHAVPDEALGSAICAALLASPAASGQADADSAALLAHCRDHLPAFMLPKILNWVSQPLPRSPNGKLDRQRWINEYGSIRHIPQ